MQKVSIYCFIFFLKAEYAVIKALSLLKHQGRKPELNPQVHKMSVTRFTVSSFRRHLS